jgi:dipeptidase E
MRLLIVSTSKIYGSGYMEYLFQEVPDFFSPAKQVLFIPYARPGGISWDAYTELAAAPFKKMGLDLKGVHEFANPITAIRQAKAIFTGGGNTFLLLKTLYETGAFSALQAQVRSGKAAYMGSSAGSNITGLSICTTNDMPIVQPPSFDAMGWVPANINPHYLDPATNSTHMGETREQRINEFHHFNEQPVWGLREGSWIRVEGTQAVLKGPHTARLFRANQHPIEISPGPIQLSGD